MAQGLPPHQAPHRGQRSLRTTSRISANGRVVKASYDVKVGDKLEIRFGARTVTLEVLSVTEMKGKENAAFMYKEL